MATDSESPMMLDAAFRRAGHLRQPDHDVDGDHGLLFRLAFSGSGQFVAASRMGAAAVWAVKTRESFSCQWGSWDQDIDGFGNGADIAVVGYQGAAICSEHGDAKHVFVTRGHARAIRAIPQSSMLAVGQDSGLIELFDPSVGADAVGSLRGHDYEISGLATSRDGRYLASTDGTCVVLWDLGQRQILWRSEGVTAERLVFDPLSRWIVSVGLGGHVRVLNPSTGAPVREVEGHASAVLEVAVSSDGGFVATACWDETIRLWRTDTWEEVVKLPAHAPRTSNWLGLAFHPTKPLLATVGRSGRSVRLWEFDAVLLRKRAPRRDAVQYSNAKVVLVGDSSVGKSGLGLVLRGEQWRETASTHARFVWTLERNERTDAEGRRILREVYLWDLAGQPGYRLVHQLHLGEVAVALVVFDAQSEIDPMSGVRYWVRALDQAKHRSGGSRVALIKMLVIGRSDRGGVAMSPQRLEEVKVELGCASVFRTSAKELWGIDELRTAVSQAIPWDRLPSVSSTELFVGIQRFLRDSKESGQILVPAEVLYQTYRSSAADGNDQGSESVQGVFDTCLGLIEGQGLLIRLRFGNLVLLQPELLDAYASAMVNAARDEPGGLGAIAEDDARQGRFVIPSDFRVADAEQERLLLIATVEHILYHEIALREPADDGVHLIFPAQLTRERPELLDRDSAVGRFRFQGPIQTIYTTLVVRLAHSPLFGRAELWRDAVEFEAKTGGSCGVQLRAFGEGDGELVLFHHGEASDQTLVEFRSYVSAHLERRALPGSIQEQQNFSCAACRTPVSDVAVRRRRERGFDWLTCNVCDERVDLAVSPQLPVKEASDAVSRIDASARTRRRAAAAEQVVLGKRLLDDYDVFICYHSADKVAVRAIAARLRARGLLPWIDEDDLQPGQSWQAQIEGQIETVKAAAVFVGPDGRGTWQEEEVRAILNRFVSSKRPVVPVLLPGALPPSSFPLFLESYHWVDFNRIDPDPIDQLEWGITGRRPK